MMECYICRQWKPDSQFPVGDKKYHYQWCADCMRNFAPEIKVDWGNKEKNEKV